MSRVKTGALVVGALVAASLTGGLVGGGAAVALVRSAYNGPVEASALPEMVVNSTELGEPVTLRIHLPMGFEPAADRSYPVFWVLDGPANGDHVAGTLRTLQLVDLAQPSIVVEVPASSRGRASDFIPPRDGGRPDAHADRFHRFLEREAGPALRAAYPVGDTEVLVGHSLGGLFALYALLVHPESFDAYFAFSPSVWVDDEAILGDLDARAEADGRLPTALYVSLGSREGNEMRSGFDAVTARLREWEPSGLRWTSMLTEGAGHGNNPELSFPVAVRWLFDG